VRIRRLVQGVNSAVPANRRLLHVPIIHNQADMGALGEAFKRVLVSRLGEEWWQRKVDLVDQVWTAIEQALACLNLRYELVRIYQDGLRFAAMNCES